MNKSLSVLIVDDDMMIGETLVDILEASGYEAMFATSGKEALSLIKEKKFDAVLLDIGMPGMDGVETLRRIKEHHSTTSVVMITAFAEEKLIDQAKAEGALCVLSKPLDIDKIVSFLEKLEALKTMFIVDDDVPFCNSLKDALSIHSYKVTIAHNAEDAIDTFSKEKSGIVLLDMKLNATNGLDVAEAIKEKGYKCTIILMSAYKKEFESLIDEALGKKVHSFVEKPFEINDLINLLDKISRKRLQKVLAA